MVCDSREKEGLGKRRKKIQKRRHRPANSRQVGSHEISKAFPDFEVQYKIEENGVRTITGGSAYELLNNRVLDVAREEDKQSCVNYDTMFASRLIIEEMWKVESSKKIMCNKYIFRDGESNKRKEARAAAEEGRRKSKNETSGAEEKSKKHKIETAEAEEKRMVSA
jgi:hypothetical protein